MKLKTICKEIQKGVKKNASKILIGMSITGMVISVGCAITATPKAMILLEEKKKETGAEKLDAKTIVKTAAPAYIPTMVAMASSAACALGASSVNDKRNAAIAAAYTMSESARTLYQRKVVDMIGAEKEQQIRQQVAVEKMEKVPEKEVIHVLKEGGGKVGMVKCFDALSGRYFWGSQNLIDRAINEANKMLLSDFELSENELFDLLGMEHTRNGDILGWDTSSNLSIETFYASKLDPEGVPCLVLDFTTPPKSLRSW